MTPGATRDLAVGEMLDQHRGEQRIVGQRDRPPPAAPAAATPRSAQRDRPGRRRRRARRSAADAAAPRRSNCRDAASARLGRARRHRRPRSRGRQARRGVVRGQRLAGDQRRRRCARTTDAARWRLAAARRAVQHQRRRRPVGPALDPARAPPRCCRRPENRRARGPAGAANRSPAGSSHAGSARSRYPAGPLGASGSPARVVEAAAPIARQREAGQHADHRGRRHREQHADKPEQACRRRTRRRSPRPGAGGCGRRPASGSGYWPRPAGRQRRCRRR